MARAAFVVGVLLHAVVLAVAAAALPGRVPLHFGDGLHADRWGSRGEFLLAQALTAVVLAALFAGLAAWVRRLRLDSVNVPDAGYWKSPEHEAELRRRLRDDVLGLGGATLAFTACAAALAVHAAVTGSGRLPVAFGVLLALYLGGTLLWCGYLVLARYRRPAGTPRAARAGR